MRTRRLLSLAVLAVFAACGAAACGPAGDPDLDLLRAENALAQGRHDWARIHFARDFAAFPQRLDSLKAEGLAWLSGYQQSLSTGIEKLTLYLEKSGPDSELERAMARAELVLGEQARVRERLPRMGEGFDTDLIAAEVLLSTDTAAALAAAERAVAAKPGEARGHLRRAEALARLGRSEDAHQAARRAAGLHPLSPTVSYLLARLERGLGREDEARRSFDLYEKVNRLEHTGTLSPLPPAEALALVSDIEAAVPEAGSALSLLRRKVELGFAAGELTVAEEALAALSNHTEVSADLLMVAAAQAHTAGRTSTAKRAIRRALELAPEHAGARLSLAQIALETGDLAAAEAALLEVAATQPHLARRHLFRARLEQVRGEEAKARASYSRAVHLAPWESGWRLELAGLLLAAGQRDEARALVAAAPEASPALEAWARENP